MFSDNINKIPNYPMYDINIEHRKVQCQYEIYKTMVISKIVSVFLAMVTTQVFSIKANELMVYTMSDYFNSYWKPSSRNDPNIKQHLVNC